MNLSPVVARIADNKPVAQNQWGLWLQSEKGDWPSFEPGQFVMLSFKDVIDPVLPRAFALVEKTPDGLYHLIYRVHGKFTERLTRLKRGEAIMALLPLGLGVEIQNKPTAFIAGGVGYASILPILQKFQSRFPQQKATVFYGLRSEIERIRRSEAETFFSTDDGSLGLKGRMDALLKSHQQKLDSCEQFFICGPTPMMKAVYDLLPKDCSIYLLEEMMGCGFGICVACVVTKKSSDGTIKKVRSCLEGPGFLGTDLEEWRQSAN